MPRAEQRENQQESYAPLPSGAPVTVQPSCDLESRVLLDRSSLSTTNGRSLRAGLRRWYHVSVLRLLVEELRSLPERTGCALEMRALEIRGYTGLSRTGMGAPLAFESQSCKRAYIRYMQQLQMDHPFLSIFDRLLVAQAWKAGSEWDDRTDTLRTQGHCSSVYPEGGNSMPPHVTQQPRARTGKAQCAPTTGAKFTGTPGASQ